MGTWGNLPVGGGSSDSAVGLKFRSSWPWDSHCSHASPLAFYMACISHLLRSGLPVTSPFSAFDHLTIRLDICQSLLVFFCADYSSPVTSSLYSYSDLSVQSYNYRRLLHLPPTSFPSDQPHQLITFCPRGIIIYQYLDDTGFLT